MNGKGDSPRNCFSEAFRDNYDRIFRKGTMKKDNPDRAAEAALKSMCAIGRKIKEPVTVMWDEYDCFQAKDGNGTVFMVGNRAAYDAAVKAFERSRP